MGVKWSFVPPFHYNLWRDLSKWNTDSHVAICLPADHMVRLLQSHENHYFLITWDSVIPINIQQKYYQNILDNAVVSSVT